MLLLITGSQPSDSTQNKQPIKSLFGAPAVVTPVSADTSTPDKASNGAISTVSIKLPLSAKTNVYWKETLSQTSVYMYLEFTWSESG